MKLRILTITLFFSSLLVFANQDKKLNNVLGINYTSAKIFILKTDGSSGPYTLFNKDSKLIKEIIKFEKELSANEQKRLNKVLKSIPNHDTGTSDWRHVAYAIVLYKGNKPVLQIFPNMVGNDVFTVPETKANSHGLTDKDYAELSRFYFEAVKIHQMKERQKQNK